jgi:hypothetical protein
MSGRASSPPGASDTGTAAPWVGTHGGHRLDSARAGLIWAAVALLAMLVAVVVFVKVRRDRADEAGLPGRGVTTTARALGAGVPESDPGALGVPLAITSTLPTQTPTVIAPTDPAPPAPKTPSTGEARRPAPLAGSRKPARAPTAAPAAPAPAAPPTGGIPSTRD